MTYSSSTDLLTRATTTTTPVVVPPEYIFPNKVIGSDICLNIFAFLPASALVTSSCVNRSWGVITNHPILWKKALSQDVRDDFAPLVAENLLNWKEAYLYARLSNFITTIFTNKYVSNEHFLRQQNPELSEQSPSLYMPRSYVKYGDYTFSICHLIDIEISIRGNSNKIVLRDKQEKMLTHLAVEGDFLFALRQDGKIVQWNYKTKEKIEIDTAYSSGDEEFRKSRRIFPGDKSAFCANFYVKNGLIIIPYHWELGAPRSRKFLEIIPYANPTQRQLIEDPSLVGSEKIILKNNQIILMGRNSIWIRNLVTLENRTYKIDIDISHMLCNMALDQRVLYIGDANKQLHRVDLKTGIINSTHCHRELYSYIMVINNLMFGYFSDFLPQITVMNMTTQEPALVKSFRLNSDDFVNNRTTNILRECITIAKTACSLSFSPTRITKKVPSSTSSKCVIA